MQIRELYQYLNIDPLIVLFPERLRMSNVQNNLYDKFAKLLELKEDDIAELRLLHKETSISIAGIIYKRFSHCDIDHFFMILDYLKLNCIESVFHKIIDFNGEISDGNHLICAAVSSTLKLKDGINFAFKIIEKYYDGNYFMIEYLEFAAGRTLLDYILDGRGGKRYMLEEFSTRTIVDAQFDMLMLLNY